MGLTSWLHKHDFVPSDGHPAASSPNGERIVDSSAASGAAFDFNETVDDAMALLVYAAETGKDVDEATRSSILQARAIGAEAADDAVTARLLEGLTKLSALVHPVTAESLRESKAAEGVVTARTGARLKTSNGADAKSTSSSLRHWALLAIPLVLYSAVAFVASSLSKNLNDEITDANKLAVQLRGQLGTLKPSADKSVPETQQTLPTGFNEVEVVTDLQTYASTIRSIDAGSRQLNFFLFFNPQHDPYADLRWQQKPNPWLTPDDKRALAEGYQADLQRQASVSQEQQKFLSQLIRPDSSLDELNFALNIYRQAQLKAKFELPVPLDINNMRDALDNLTRTYQDVRTFAKSVIDPVTVLYGAISTCLLPVFYALLGTCAYLLRCFEQELRNKTFTPTSRANRARFLIAAIGGTVVGLFGNFTAQGNSVSPLAIAFLVGYAVDVFFSFLEGIIQGFSARKNGATSPATGNAS